MRRVFSKPPDLATALILLSFLLIGLKLAGVIDWTWWTVTAPVWGPFAIVAAIFVVLGIATALNAIIP